MESTKTTYKCYIPAGRISALLVEIASVQVFYFSFSQGKHPSSKRKFFQVATLWESFSCLYSKLFHDWKESNSNFPFSFLRPRKCFSREGVGSIATLSLPFPEISTAKNEHWLIPKVNICFCLGWTSQQPTFAFCEHL